MAKLAPWKTYYEIERKMLESRIKGDILSDPSFGEAGASARLAGLEEWWSEHGEDRWRATHPPS